MSGIAGNGWGERLVSVAEPRKSKPWTDLGPRLASALVLMGGALGTAFAGGLVFDLFWLAASIGILWEWLRLVGGARRVVHFAFGTMVLVAAAFAASTASAGLAIGLLGIGGLGIAATSEASTRALAGSGLLYAGALIVAVSLLRHSASFGRDAILFLFAVVWGTDCMAYFGGRLLGGPRLASRLSPSKTWSGFLVGIVSGSLFGLAVSPAGTAVAPVVLLSLLAGIVAQGGDIFESGLKRRFKVKDAGSLIPGHGGLMDRLDGFLAAAVLAASIGALRFGVEAAGAGLFVW